MKTYWIIQRPDGTLVANTKRRHRDVAIRYFLRTHLTYQMKLAWAWAFYNYALGYRCVEVPGEKEGEG